MDQGQLEKYKTISSIFATVAVPIVIAAAGWFIQSTIADNAVKKDYVQIAVNILADGTKKPDKDLRSWAAAVIEKNSPVPFSEKAKSSLETVYFPMYPRIPALPDGIQKSSLGYMSKLKSVLNKNISEKELLLLFIDEAARAQKDGLNLNYCIDAYQIERQSLEKLRDGSPLDSENASNAPKK